MTLILEIEFLAGVSFAAIGPDSPVPDWPPQPDRIFSALVAAWAGRGEDGEEAMALQWLEQMPAPLLTEPGAEPRTSVTVFVPPNDPQSSRRKTARGVFPALRSRQPRQFPAARPNGPILRLVWLDARPEESVFNALEHLARDTAYVGHSSSLTRCRFLLDGDAADLSGAKAPAVWVYPGRFQELRAAYARFQQSASAKDRPQKGAAIPKRLGVEGSRSSNFADNWLILEHVGGQMPDVRACAIVARTLRDAVLAGYQRVGLGGRIPEVVSGHTSDGAPTRQPHMAILPLAFVGFPYADGHVMGYAVVPPRQYDILNDEDFRKSLRAIAKMDGERERRILTVRTRRGTPVDAAFSIELSPTIEAGRRSLDPALYVGRARTFATVTPIALDRHLKHAGDGREHEVQTQVATACRNIGLPEPEAIVDGKHSALEGAPSAYPWGKSPGWLCWRTPRSLAGRQLTHAVIRFREPVDGPVILGAGRFLGLGLCRPLDREG